MKIRFLRIPVVEASVSLEGVGGGHQLTHLLHIFDLLFFRNNHSLDAIVRSHGSHLIMSGTRYHLLTPRELPLFQHDVYNIITLAPHTAPSALPFLRFSAPPLKLLFSSHPHPPLPPSSISLLLRFNLFPLTPRSNIAS